MTEMVFSEKNILDEGRMWTHSSQRQNYSVRNSEIRYLLQHTEPDESRVASLHLLIF